MNDIYERLKAPFPPDAVSWRVGSTNKEKTKGMALAYIDARDVMNRLDEVCGPAGWMDRYEFHGTRTVCYLSIAIPTTNRPDGDWITKADGAGDSDVEAEKGSISDSFKRAAVKWGIGRYLYDLPSPWVELDTYEAGGKTFVRGIKTGEFATLRRLLAPAKATPPPPAPPAKAPLSTTEENRIAIGNKKAIAAYIDTFKFALGKCDFESEVLELWVEQSAERRKLGITPDSEAGMMLVGLRRDRIEEIGLSMANAEAAGVQ